MVYGGFEINEHGVVTVSEDVVISDINIRPEKPLLSRGHLKEFWKILKYTQKIFQALRSS